DDEVLVALRILAGDVGLARSRLRLARDLQRSEERFRALVRHAPDAITIHDPDGVVTYASPAMSRILGVEAATLLGTSWLARLDQRDRDRFKAALDDAAREPDEPVRLEYRVTDAHGTQRWLEAWVTNLLAEPGVHGIVANHRDTTASRHLRARLEHEATHDALTGLANRRRFTRALERTRVGGTGVLVLIDLDRFKAINDRFGHAAGDEVLLEVTHRLRTTIRPTDLAARLGGDEFAVLLPDTDAAAGAAVVERLRSRLADPVQLRGGALTISASFGTALLGTGATSSDELLHDADLAMYADKRRVRPVRGPTV
ncbi:MAG: diguanylate cyclase domain-containing protein, partial [Nitriliruptoraceae bacterium]